MTSLCYHLVYLWRRLTTHFGGIENQRASVFSFNGVSLYYFTLYVLYKWILKKIIDISELDLHVIMIFTSGQNNRLFDVCGRLRRKPLFHTRCETGKRYDRLSLCNIFLYKCFFHCLFVLFAFDYYTRIYYNKKEYKKL